MPFIRHCSASGLAQLALDPRLGCTGCPEAGWCHSCLPGELSLPGSCRKLRAMFTSFQAVPLAGHTGLFASSSCFRDAGKGDVGAGCPSLSRRAACPCTADCGPLPSAAISEGGKNNGDLKGSEVCVGGGLCALSWRSQGKQTHVCTCVPAYIHVQWKPGETSRSG